MKHIFRKLHSHPDPSNEPPPQSFSSAASSCSVSDHQSSTPADNSSATSATTAVDATASSSSISSPTAAPSYSPAANRQQQYNDYFSSEEEFQQQLALALSSAESFAQAFNVIDGSSDHHHHLGGRTLSPWDDSYGAIYSAEEMVSWRRRKDWNIEEAVIVDHAMVELKFLYTYLGYAYIWSSKESASASSPNYHQVKVVADEAEELLVYLKTNFIDRFINDDPDPPPQHPRPQDSKSWWGWGRTRVDPLPVPVPVPVPSLGDVFTHLNQQIACLKPRIIREAASRLISLPPSPTLPMLKNSCLVLLL